MGDALLAVAREAFVHGMQVVSLLSVVLAGIVAAVAVLGLRHVEPTDVEPLADDGSSGNEAPADLAAAASLTR